MTISAELVEGIVTYAVRAALSDAEGRASAERGRREAERVAEQAQEVLDSAIRAFAGAGIDGEPTAVEQLGELREARDAAREHVEQLGGDRTDAVVVNAGADWDRLTLDERRALIRAVVASVTVATGRAAGRVSVQLVGE